MTAETLARLDAASRALASPLAAPDAHAWRAGAARAVRLAVGADHAVFGLTDAADPYVLDGLDAAQWAPYAAHVTPRPAAPDDPASWRTADPVVDHWLAAHQHAGGGAFDETVMARALAPHGLRLAQSDLIVAVAHPNRMYALRGMTAAAGTVSGTVGGGVQLSSERPGGGSADDLLHLRVLVPALRAGLEAHVRFAAHRASLAAALDALPEATAAFDADGRERYRNRALVAMLGAEPEALHVEAALVAAVRRLRPFAFARRGEGTSGLPPLPAVGTARAAYTLAGTAVPEGALGAWGGIVVTLTARPVAP